jgi:hypothetical protein
METGDPIQTVTGKVLRTDSNLIFNGRIGDSFPNSGPMFVTRPSGSPAQALLRKDRDNWFDIFFTARSGNLNERLVVSWDGDSWEYDYELKRLKDNKGNPEQILHRIRDDFRYVSKP